MRIAQIARLAESVPPKLYGGTERVVAWLVEELVELGHSVTLFASGDSSSKAELIPVCPRALRLGKPRPDPMAAQTALLEAVAQRADEFDVIHAHIDWLHLPIVHRAGVPFLTTLHGRLDLPGLSEMMRPFSKRSICFYLRQSTHSAHRGKMARNHPSWNAKELAQALLPPGPILGFSRPADA